MADPISITQDELNALIQAGVEKEKLSILIGDFKQHKEDEEKRLLAIDHNVASIFELVREFPDKVNKCRDELENDIHRELENHYVTTPDLKILSTSLNAKIDSINIRVKWTIGVIVAGAGIIQFAFTMWYMGLQITKLASG